MMKKRYFSIILSVIMAFSAVTVFELAFTQSSIVAYAASLSAPSVKASNASYKSVKLTWKKIKGAKKYTVLRSTKKSSGYKAIKTVTKNTYTDTKATCGKTYYYKVTAVKGNTKKTSKAVKIKCTPAKVSGIKAASTVCSDVKITFKKVSGASGYDISYCSAKSGKYKSVAVIKSTSYTHSIGAGNTGYYKVRAYRTVKGKKVYGPYSSVVSVTALSHSYSEWETVSPSTCIAKGIQTSVCSICGDVQYRELPMVASHSYGSYTVEKSPTCGEAGTKYTVCSICGDKHYEVMPATGEHVYITTAEAPANCTETGRIVKACKNCGKTIITPTDERGSHTLSTNYVVKKIAEADGTEATHLYCTCSLCNEEIETDTFCLDITDVTADSLAPYAGIAELSPSGHKITLTATKYIDNFEISGTAKDITISVDAFDDAEVKLCGLTISNETASVIDDCIRINDKCTETEPVLDANGNPTYASDGTPITEKIVPTVSISAKDGTVNTFKVTAAGGNAIECSTKLEFKGHGTLNMDTVSTAIDVRAKLYIRNLTMDIKSSTNRGIDTKIETKNDAGVVIDTDYANISFGANANVSINSTDDGIRCKNMVFEKIDTALGDTDTTVLITSGGDAIQLEGKKGLTMNQGYMTLKGTKSAVNEKSGLNTYQTYVTSGRITIA
ncbi:MAG: hypothetical protein ACI4XC_04205 [Eubacterium sp.]